MKDLSLYVILLPAFYSAYSITCYLHRWWCRFHRKETTQKPTSTFQNLFTLHIEQVYTNQSLATLSKVKDQTITTLSRKPLEPLLLIFLTAEDAKTTALSLAKRLIQVTLTAKNKQSLPWSATEKFVIPGSTFTSISSPWDFYEAIQKKITEDDFIIITEFEKVNQHAADLIIYSFKELFFPEKQAFIYLIIEVPSLTLSSTSNALNQWLTSRQNTHFEMGLLKETQRSLYLRTCLIKPEDESALS